MQITGKFRELSTRCLLLPLLLFKLHVSLVVVKPFPDFLVLNSDGYNGRIIILYAERDLSRFCGHRNRARIFCCSNRDSYIGNEVRISFKIEVYFFSKSCARLFYENS